MFGHGWFPKGGRLAPAVWAAPGVHPGAAAVFRGGRRPDLVRDTTCPGPARRQAGVNIGSGGPPSLGTSFSFTSWPTFSVLKSQSTMLVIIVVPSSTVT